MELFASAVDKPPSKTRRYIISAVVLVILIALGLWYALRFTPEKHTVERFMDSLLSGNTQQAYQIWHPHPSFTYQDFLGYWGPQGYYSPLKSYQVKKAEMPAHASGVIVTLEVSPYAPFPKPEEATKSAENREVQLWVERSDQSLSFPPP